ncbi:helix-turn-helix transcriptional regulator [Streptomyces sp. NP160]|nr:helix-turn-helix transcriptional regulator [Streptomyces sp. NP160]
MWAGCAGVGAASGGQPGAALLAARCAAGAVVVLTVLAAGVVLAALLDGAPLLLLVGAVALLAAAGLEAWRRASGWAAALLEEARPSGPPDAGPAVALADPPPGPVAAHAGAREPVPAAPAARAPAPRGWEELTPREREVLSVLASGASNAGIAAELGISPRTVEAHLRSAFTRLRLDPADGANRRVVAARMWLEHGAGQHTGRRAAG